ncbi:hypothetical protein [Enterococcus hirae]|nr:hypothetical protein [Enterococcus hirae]
MHHYITKYKNENGNGSRKAVAWFQINIFGKCFCLFKHEIAI